MIHSSSIPELNHTTESQSIEALTTGSTFTKCSINQVAFSLLFLSDNECFKNSSGLCLLMFMCPGVPEWSGSEMRFIGYVEISEEASLDDLKTQVGITTHSINDSSR